MKKHLHISVIALVSIISFKAAAMGKSGSCHWVATGPAVSGDNPLRVDSCSYESPMVKYSIGGHTYWTPIVSYYGNIPNERTKVTQICESVVVDSKPAVQVRTTFTPQEYFCTD